VVRHGSFEANGRARPDLRVGQLGDRRELTGDQLAVLGVPDGRQGLASLRGKAVALLRVASGGVGSG
jgi:hypothetical protein